MPRSLRQALEVRRDAEADLVEAEYVRPQGTRMHVVRLIPGQQEIIVGSMAGGWTWAPGAQVVIGTFSGSRERAIIGHAPPGKQGASAFPQNPTSTEVPGRPTILAAIPAAVISGQTDQVVYLIGLSLREEYSYEALVGAPGIFEADPFVTIREPVELEEPESEDVTGIEVDGVQIEGLEVDPIHDVIKVIVDVDVAAPAEYPVTVGVRY